MGGGWDLPVKSKSVRRGWAGLVRGIFSYISLRELWREEGESLCKGTSYSFPLLSLQGQKGREKKKKPQQTTKQINRAICNPEHTAACQTPLTAATEKAFL